MVRLAAGSKMMIEWYLEIHKSWLIIIEDEGKGLKVVLEVAVVET